MDKLNGTSVAQDLYRRPNCTVFRQALDKYLHDLPPGKHKKDFIRACYDPAAPITAVSVNDVLEKMQRERSNNASVASRIVKRVVRALKEYDGIVNSLASADPMPTAIIWGALSVVLNGAQRYFKIFDTIKTQLYAVAHTLECIALHEQLFGDCVKMQRLLCDSYINLLRFWSKVHKELTRPAVQSMMMAGLPFSTEKLNGIVDEIDANFKAMAERASLLEKQNAKSERTQASAERALQSGWREEDCIDRLKTTIMEWLQRSSVSRADFSRYDDLKEQRMEGTCDWLFAHPTYADWINGAVPSLWLSAAPGAGKSVLCSRLVESLEEGGEAVAVAYHFYRFDEPSSAADVLVHMAYQLFAHHVKTSLDVDILQDFADMIRLRGNTSSAYCSKQIISTLVQRSVMVYFLVDGVDEESTPERYREAVKVLSFLQSLADDHPRKVRLWGSSQNVPSTIAAYARYTPLHVKDEMERDMMSYLSSALTTLKLPDDAKDRVLATQEHDPGSFLWAKLMIGDLDNANSPAELARVVEEGPTLDQYYLRFFQRLERKAHVLACYIFGLVAFARRPLRIGELREAIGILRSRDALKERREAHTDSTALETWPTERGLCSQNPSSAVSLDTAEMPYTTSLLRLFAPLIEVEETQEDEDGRPCRLYHSTVLAFLLKNPDILCKVHAPSPRICSRIMADACLLYLAQPRYSTLLAKRDDTDGWRDQTGSTVRSHRLLTYAAKYWNKHLNLFHDSWCLPPEEEIRDYFLPRIVSFLTSTNFQTCLQIQSLFIEAQFGHFAPGDQPVARYTFLRRPLPDWFAHSETGLPFVAGYHRFWYEWSRFLSCDCDCLYESAVHYYAGQLDRCWWGALGPTNFLSRMPCRYTTFAYEYHSRERPVEPLPENSIFKTIGVTRDGLRILRLVTLVRGYAKFVCQIWMVDDDARPVLRRSQTLEIEDEPGCLERYVQRTAGDSDAGLSRADVGLLAAFSSDCRYLRIGPQIFEETIDGTYEPYMTNLIDEQYPKYIEEFACRGPYLVVAARNSSFSASTLYCEPQHAKKPRPEIARRRARGERGDGTLAVEEDSTDSECDADSASDSVDDIADDAYESWSECTSGAKSDFSEVEGAEDSESDEEGGPTRPPTSRKNSNTESEADEGSLGDAESDGGQESEGDEDCDPEDEGLPAHGGPGDSDSGDESYAYNARINRRAGGRRQAERGYAQMHDKVGDFAGRSMGPAADHSDSDADDESDVDPRAFAYGQIQRYGEDISSDEEDRRLPTALCRRTGDAAKNSCQQTSLSVFMPSEGRIFRFARLSKIVLFDSPPVMHPSLPFVVWPLGGGDMLFADIDEGTYFIRKIRSSTPQTRPIFMKCRFSSCGSHLHVASLEGRQTPSQDVRQHDQGTKLSLALIVRTYRLCRKQPCRSPPSLVHYTRLQLGEVASLPIQRSPFKISWTDEHLYLAWTNEILKVFRVRLFSTQEASSDTAAPVVRPRETLILPESARWREVYFFPTNVAAPRSRIVIAGVITRDDDLAPTDAILAPVGCDVDEERDLGGWTDSDEVTAAPKGRRDGRLDLPLEKFDPEEDCDLEQFLFLG